MLVIRRPSLGKAESCSLDPVETKRKVGACIYCDATGRLSDEHVIPFELNGTIVLEQASCATCAAETSRIERKLLRGHWWPLRRQLGLRSRRPKDQRDTFVATTEVDGELESIDIPAAKWPVLTVFDFDVPGYLVNRFDAGAPISPRPFLKQLAPLPVISSKRKGVFRAGRQKVTLPVNIEVVDFIRLIAKVALGYAVFIRGLEAFEQFYVREIVLGKTDGATTYVGRAMSLLLPERLAGEGPHGLLDTIHGRDVSVYVQLFRDLPGDPLFIYEVVVGRLRSGAELRV